MKRLYIFLVLLNIQEMHAQNEVIFYQKGLENSIINKIDSIEKNISNQIFAIKLNRDDYSTKLSKIEKLYYQRDSMIYRLLPTELSKKTFVETGLWSYFFQKEQVEKSSKKIRID